MWVCLAGCAVEDPLTASGFNDAYQDTYCHTAWDCRAGVTCEVDWLPDPGSCEFDSDQGQACLDAEWECQLFYRDDVVVTPPSDCLHVYRC